MIFKLIYSDGLIGNVESQTASLDEISLKLVFHKQFFRLKKRALIIEIVFILTVTVVNGWEFKFWHRNFCKNNTTSLRRQVRFVFQLRRFVNYT